MCVCDLGGVYIKPTRPWVVAPLPSPFATIKRRRPVSLCQLVQLTCSPRHLFTLSPCHLFTCSRLVIWSRLVASGHLFTWSSASHLVTWSSCHLVICSRLRVSQLLRLHAHLSPFPVPPIHPRKNLFLRGAFSLDLGWLDKSFFPA